MTIARSVNVGEIPASRLRSKNCSAVPPGCIAVGVGSRLTVSVADPPRVARGVGNTKPSGTSVTRADVGSSYNSPSCVIPEAGKVCNDSGCGESKDPWNVLQHDESGSYHADGCCDVGPEVSVIFSSFALTSMRERLAWKPRRDDIYGFDSRPVKSREVSEVRNVWVAVRKNLAGTFVDVGNPCEFAAQHVLHSFIQGPETGTEGTYAHH